jgi:hypothetical protein
MLLPLLILFFSLFFSAYTSSHWVKTCLCFPSSTHCLQLLISSSSIPVGLWTSRIYSLFLTFIPERCLDHTQHELRPLPPVLTWLKVQFFIHWPSISVILDSASFFSISSEFNFSCKGIFGPLSYPNTQSQSKFRISLLFAGLLFSQLLKPFLQPDVNQCEFLKW